MHLHDLLSRENRNLSASEGATPARRMIDGDLILGLTLPTRVPGRVVLHRASQHPHFLGLEDVGLVATLGTGFSPSPLTTRITVSYVTGEQRTSRTSMVHSNGFSRLLLPNILDLADPFVTADLVIEVDGAPEVVFIGSSGRTPRDALYRLARGIGVEIGPGPRPQILNGPETQVTYVEEMPAQDWVSLYRPDANQEAWQQPGYIIGKAHELPVEDGSLDFIFSSHVLEHLYNPLGHLDHWRRKLRVGGLVLGVVPSTAGTKDFVQPPTSLLDLIDEHRAGEFAVPLSTYVNWVRHLQPGLKDPLSAAKKYFDSKSSIHVHVYDYVTVTNLLRHCVEAHGYSDYRLFYKHNAKDFIFALKAGPLAPSRADSAGNGGPSSPTAAEISSNI